MQIVTGLSTMYVVNFITKLSYLFGVLWTMHRDIFA